MSCTTCFETMQGLGDSWFWCPTCGTVARQTTAGLTDIERPRLTAFALAPGTTERLERKVEEICSRRAAAMTSEEIAAEHKAT